MSWLRQWFAWSDNWLVWRERLLALSFVLLGTLLIWLSTLIGVWPAATLWAVFFITLAVCSRQGWIKLLGPVLFYDMLRTSRRSRYIIMRLLYAGLLLVILTTMYFSLEVEQRFNQQRDSAMLAQIFFSVFMLVQISLVVLLTPAYVAGAIAEEKDRKTLEFLLATDLHNREIVLSKLLSRLANLTLFLLTGLPILSILQFVGGVDTQLMLAGFAGTGLTMLGIASVCIFLSTMFKRPRDAIGLSYLCIIAYIASATFAFGWVMGGRLTTEGIWPFYHFMDNPPTYGDLSYVVNTGNPLTAIIRIAMAIEGRAPAGGRTTLAAELPEILGNYAWFHIPLSLICIGTSILRLRAVALKQGSGGKTAKLSWWERFRPPVGELPMLWKELHIEGGTKLNWLSLIIVAVLVFLTLGSGLLVLGSHIGGWNAPWWSLTEHMNIWFRIAGTGTACLLILHVAVRSSTTITTERERDTFDALIATPMSDTSILGAKVIGTLSSLRLGWLWYGSLLTMAVVTGGIHLLAVPIVIVAWFIYALFFTMVGTWFSMVCKSSMRATVYTVITTLVLGGGHWLLTGMCMTCAGGPGPHDGILYFLKFQLGMTPPAVLGICAYSWEDLAENFIRDEVVELFIFSLIGLFLWAMGCLVLWFGVLVPQFRQIARREEIVYH